MKLAKNSVVSNDGYVFNRKTGESFTLNAIAVDLLRLLEDEERDMECLTNYIMENYQVDNRSIIYSDLSDFFFYLSRNGIIED